MTNPNDAIGTNAAYGGRTSVNAFNDLASAFTRGIVSGWECVPNSGLTVSLGGDGTNRDVAIAIDNAGNRTTINNISGSPVDITIDSAPASNSRIDSIVAYVDNPANGVNNVVDNPGACGIIAVKGTAAVNPTAPNESTIRTAITADGASGTTAYYVVLANITIASGTTDIVSGNIAAGPIALTQNYDMSNWQSAYGIATNILSHNTDTATSVLTATAPQDGIYLVTASGGAYSSSTSFYISLGKNGTEDTDTKQLIISTDSSVRLSTAISNVYTLSSGDVVNFMLANNGGASTVSIRKGYTLALVRIG